MVVKVLETLGKIPENLKPQVIFFFIYVVENGGVSTGEFQHRQHRPLYLSTKRLIIILQAERHSLEASH